RNEAVSGIHSLATTATSEIFDESTSAAFNRIARTKIDRAGDELAPGLRRWRAERDLGRVVRPDRLDDRLEQLDRDAGAGVADAQRATLAVGVVVADPDGHGHVVGE